MDLSDVDFKITRSVYSRNLKDGAFQQRARAKKKTNKMEIPELKNIITESRSSVDQTQLNRELIYWSKVGSGWRATKMENMEKSRRDRGGQWEMVVLDFFFTIGGAGLLWIPVQRDCIKLHCTKKSVLVDCMFKFKNVN